MSTAEVLKPTSVAEYLRTEPESPVKREYVRGTLRARAGTSGTHNRLAVRLAARLLDAAEARGCRVYASDVRLRVAEDVYYYPDVMVVCAEDPDRVQQTKPCLVVEVLSRSTRSIDLWEKRLAYTGIESLEAYLVFEADRASVTGYYRTADGFEERRWEDEGSIDAPCAGTALDLAALYRGL